MTATLRALAVVVALVATTWPHAVSAASPATAATATAQVPVSAETQGRTVHLGHPKVFGGLMATAAESPDDPILAGALVVGGAAVTDPVSALHPDGTVLYVAVDRLHGRRGLLRVVTTDARKPAVTTEIPLSPGLVPSDLALDAVQGRLYVASGTHTVVLDLAVPAAPQVIGRIADVMIASHDRIELQVVADPTFGWRTFLSVTTHFAGGEGCRPGNLHVLDVSGRLQDAPIEVVETTAPRPDGDWCPTPSLRLDAERRRLAVDWIAAGAAVRTDHAPYDITAAFQATAELCRLVRV